VAALTRFFSPGSRKLKPPRAGRAALPEGAGQLRDAGHGGRRRPAAPGDAVEGGRGRRMAMPPGEIV